MRAARFAQNFPSFETNKKDPSRFDWGLFLFGSLVSAAVLLVLVERKRVLDFVVSWRSSSLSIRMIDRHRGQEEHDFFSVFRLLGASEELAKDRNVHQNRDSRDSISILFLDQSTEGYDFAGSHVHEVDCPSFAGLRKASTAWNQVT